jgi:hypothetical protein
VNWFAVNRGCLEYRGRVTKPAFARWCATRDGREAIARAASGIRFSIFGRSRSARRRLWRDLDEATREESFVVALRGEPDRYMQVLADISYAEALPRAHVAVRRLVLVPRALAAGRAEAGVFARLGASPALADLDHALRDFLLRQIVVEMDAALKAASPSARRPIRGCDGWVCVGIRVGTVWMDALWAGPDGTGHVFMYELPPQGLSRRECRELDTAIEQMSTAVSALSRTARESMLRAATLRRA